MDYLEATERRSTTILLHRKKLRVKRANLGLHYRLSIVLDRWQEARNSRDYENIVALTFAYIALATDQDIEYVEQASLTEIMLAFVSLTALNLAQDDLPFMRMKGRKEEYEYEYGHRALADWVARLSRHYHWTSDYILNKLTPEEAICYMQEAILHDHEYKEFFYRLSDIAYKIVGKGKNARAKYVPFPKPSWMAKKLPKIMVPKTWVPQGNVIQAGDIGKQAD